MPFRGESPAAPSGGRSAESGFPVLGVSMSRSIGLLRRAPRAAVLAVAGLALLAGAPAGAERPRIAILPIVVHTLDDGDYLRAGMADMLASRLGRAPGVGVIRVSDPAAATTELAKAQEAARAVGADWVLFGSFTRFGEGASLDVRCAPVAGEPDDGPRSIFIQAGTLGDIIPRLDALAERVGRYVASGGTATPDVAAGPGDTGAGLSSLRSELRTLRERVEVLEAGGGGEDVPEVDLGRREVPAPALNPELR